MTTPDAPAREGASPPPRRPLTPPPFLLDDPGTIWEVVEGRVDLFSIPAGGGVTAGPRRHLVSVAAGGALVGVEAAGGARPVVLLAVPVGGTTLKASQLSDLTAGASFEGGRRELVMRVRAVSRVVARALEVRTAPRIHVGIDEGETLDLPAGQRLSSADATVPWLRLESGTATICDDGPAVTPASPFVPIGRGLWLRSSEGARVRAVTGVEAVRETSAAEGLRLLAAYFHDWAQTQAQDDEDAEFDRFAAKSAAEERLRARGIKRLASLLNPGDDALGDIDPGSDYLFAALQFVGAASNIRFVPAPSWEREAKRNDPLAAICRASRVRFRQVGLRGEWWLKDAGPILAFTKDEREPVAVLWQERSGYHLVDPKTQRRALLNAAVVAGLEPMAFSFYPPFPEEPVKGKTLLQAATHAIRAEIGELGLIAAASAVLGLIIPWATGKMLSEIVPVSSYSGALTLVLALIAVQIGNGFFDVAKAFTLVRIEGKSNAALQAGVVDRLLALPVPFYREYTVGDLASRAGAINAVRDLLSGAAGTSLLSGVFAIAFLIQLWWYSWRLAFVAIAVMLVAAVFTFLVARRSVRLQRVQQQIAGRLSGLVVQLIGAIPKLRVAGAEGRAFSVWSERFREQKRIAERASRTDNVVQVFNAVLPLLASLALFAYAGWMAKEGKDYALTPAEFVAFNAAFGTFFASGVQLSNSALTMLGGIPMLERAQPILHALPEVGSGRTDPGELTGRIEATHVSFRYRADGPTILDDVSFHAEPGEFIAFVGSSGSGKSTCLRLLLAFEQPETGAIYYDRQDLSTLDVSAVRSQIGVVLQSSKLSSGDIFQNIVGSAPLSMDDAWEAADAAGLSEDIDQMPMQLHTVVSEGGSTLSGGQRQRLLIARALVRKPRVILFDEATSALDNRTQELVSRSLEKMNATRIVIAHRLSTVRNADRIYVIDRGRVVQSGSYEDLAAVPGMFADLIRRQLA